MSEETIKVLDKTTAFVVWTNADLTEGRGQSFPKSVCLLESTAIRLGEGKYVQGSDCPIREQEVFKYGGEYYGPIHLVPPTMHDEDSQEIMDEKRKALEKAKEAGLTADEIKALSNH